MIVIFYVVHEKNHSFGGRQLDYRALQIGTPRITADVAHLCGWFALHCEIADRSEFAQFRNQGPVDGFRIGLVASRKGAAKGIRHHFFRSEFVVGHIKRQRIHPMAISFKDVPVVIDRRLLRSLDQGEERGHLYSFYSA